LHGVSSTNSIVRKWFTPSIMISRTLNLMKFCCNKFIMFWHYIIRGEMYVCILHSLGSSEFCIHSKLHIDLSMIADKPNTQSRPPRSARQNRESREMKDDNDSRPPRRRDDNAQNEFRYCRKLAVLPTII
jgi:hypothetical protein